LLRGPHIARALAGGLLAGGLTAILPGLGAAHASVFGMLLAAGTGDHGFLSLTGVIGTTNFFLSLAAYDSVGKARNGALLAATQVSPVIPFYAAVGAALLGGGIGLLLTLLIGKYAARLLAKIPYHILSLCVLGFVSALVIILTGPNGLLLYVTGCALGLIAAASKAARAHAMACILIPVAARFLA
jgi:TctA family transporter